jgi:hypothetical protein
VSTTNGVFAFSSGKPCKDGKGNNKYGVRFLFALAFSSSKPCKYWKFEKLYENNTLYENKTCYYLLTLVLACVIIY